VVDLDPALGEEFLDVAVGQAQPQAPADCDHDEMMSGGKRKPAKADRGQRRREGDEVS
jgi:hypothetical protein